MFPDPASSFATLVLEAIGHRPAAQYTDDVGVGHRMWRVVDPGLVGRLQALLGGVKAYIADGHHRHATALRYRDAVGPDGAWTLGYFTPIEAPGLVVQPYHRILSEGPSLDEAGKRLAERVPAHASNERGRGRLRGGDLARALRFRPGRAREGCARGRGRAWGRAAALARGPGLPARARHVLPAPRGSGTSPRCAGRGRELRPLAGRGGGGAVAGAPATSPC